MAAAAPAPFVPPTAPGTIVIPEKKADITASATTPKAVMPPPKQVKKQPISESKVIGAKISLQFVGENGDVYESNMTIDSKDFKIQKHSLEVDEKHEKKRDPETKDLIGFEDTGERVLTFKLRYHVR